MAVVGQQLLAAESEMTRYDSNNGNISKIGDGWGTDFFGGYYGGSMIYTNVIGSYAAFNFTGTSVNIIIYADNLSVRATASEVWIDGVKVGLVSAYNKYNPSSQCEVGFVITGLQDKEHSLKFLSTESKYMILDAIDIDSAGILKPYNEIIVVNINQAMSCGT